MQQYKIKKVKVPELEYIVCDRCEKKITDDFELQEMHHINFVGGYSSIFGDGSVVACDLCQHCLHEMIKDFCNIDLEKD